MVTISRDDVVVPSVCAVCHTTILEFEKSVVVVSVPEMSGHMICRQDWTAILASAYATLHVAAGGGPNAGGDALRRAYELFFGEDE